MEALGLLFGFLLLGSASPFRLDPGPLRLARRLLSSSLRGSLLTCRLALFLLSAPRFLLHLAIDLSQQSPVSSHDSALLPEEFAPTRHRAMGTLAT